MVLAATAPDSHHAHLSPSLVAWPASFTKETEQREREEVGSGCGHLDIWGSPCCFLIGTLSPQCPPSELQLGQHLLFSSLMSLEED